MMATLIWSRAIFQAVVIAVTIIIDMPSNSGGNGHGGGQRRRKLVRNPPPHWTRGWCWSTILRSPDQQFRVSGPQCKTNQN